MESVVDKIEEKKLVELQNRVAELEIENEQLKLDKYRLEEQLTAAFDGTGLCLWEQHIPSGKLTIFNMEWGEMLGFHANEFEATVESWKNHLHPNDKDEVIEALRSHLAGESEYYQAVHRMLRKDGGNGWVSDRGRVVEFDTEGRPLRMMGTHVDITTEREEVIVAEASAKAKHDFLAMMNHELRTPMNAIVGLGALLKFSQLDTTQKEYVEKLELSCGYMMQLINNVLDFAKVKENSFELEQHGFLLNIALRTVKNILAQKAEEKGLELNLVGENLLPIAITGDRGHLSQVLINLINNAIKYTEDGEVSLAVRQLASPTDTSVRMEFSVFDTGIGISAEDMNTLFDPYKRITNSGSALSEGVGLGLAISKSLVELMGGQLQVESKVGEGSRFYFDLIFEIAQDYVISTDIGSTDLDDFVLPTGVQILLTDDAPLNRYVGSEMIKNMGGSVSLASTGEAAIVQLQQKSFDVILMDISLPGKNGFEVCQWVKKHGLNPNTPIIALTAHDLTQVKQKCQEAGMDGFLSKPFEYQDLYQAIYSALEDKQ